MPTIGVLPRTITTTLGNRTLTMATRTTTIRTTQIGFVLFGILNKPFIYTVGQTSGSVLKKYNKCNYHFSIYSNPKLSSKKFYGIF